MKISEERSKSLNKRIGIDVDIKVQYNKDEKKFELLINNEVRKKQDYQFNPIQIAYQISHYMEYIDKKEKEEYQSSAYGDDPICYECLTRNGLYGG